MDKIEKNSFLEVILVEQFIYKHTGLEFCFEVGSNRVSGLQCTNPKQYKKFITKQKKFK
jgi:hypothetical protein